MNYKTRKTLTILLPIALILLAVGGLVGLRFGGILTTDALINGLVTSLVSWVSIFVVLGVDRHQVYASEEAFLSSLLIAAVSYLLPVIIGIQLALWVILILRNTFNARVFVASLLGYAALAIIYGPLVCLGLLDNNWVAPFETTRLMPAIVVGLFWLSYILVTIVRQSLRVR